LCWLYDPDRAYHVSVIIELSPLPLLKLALMLSLISKLMVACWIAEW
jgi:hypothetical protein